VGESKGMGGSGGEKLTLDLLPFKIRRAFRNIRKTLPEIANVLILLLLMIALFTLLGSKLFGKRYNNFFKTKASGPSPPPQKKRKEIN